MSLKCVPETPVGRTVEGEHHNPARLPVQSVVERRVGGGGTRLLQVAEDAREEIVVGVRRGLLAWRTRFLVVGQEILVLKEDARGVDFVEAPRPAPGPPDADFLSAGESFCRIAHRPAVHLDGTEVDEIGGFGFGQKELFCEVRGKGDARRSGVDPPPEGGRTEPGQSRWRGSPFIRHRACPRRSPHRPVHSRPPWLLPPSRPRPLPWHPPFRDRPSSSTWPWSGDRPHPVLP